MSILRQYIMHIRDPKNKKLSLCGANRGLNHNRKIMFNDYDMGKRKCKICINIYENYISGKG